jgi:hypothetical protein
MDVMVRCRGRGEGWVVSVASQVGEGRAAHRLCAAGTKVTYTLLVAQGLRETTAR